MVKRLRLFYWRCTWSFYWGRHDAILKTSINMGLAPKPPAIDYRGERLPELNDRLDVLLARYTR